MNQDRLAQLIDWYQTLTPETLARLPEFYTDDARFVDPFNDVTGHAAIAAIFRHMFATLQNPQFAVEASYSGNDGLMLRWQFRFALRQRQYSIPGSSHLVLAADGRIASHVDYWDSAALYRQLPMVGGVFRWLTRRMATPNLAG